MLRCRLGMVADEELSDREGERTWGKRKGFCRILAKTVQCRDEHRALFKTEGLD